MKKIWICLGMVFALSAQAQSNTFNYTKINQVIAKVLLPLYSGNPVVTDLALKVDPSETDLNANRVSVSASTTVRNSLWSAQPSTLTTVLHGEAVNGSSSGIIHLKMNLNVKASTDSLALIKYLVQLAMSDSSGCITSSEPLERQLEILICGQVPVLLQVKDLAELRGVFEKVRSGVVGILQKEITSIDQKIAAGPTPRVVSQLMANKKELQASLSFTEAITFQAVQDSLGNEIGFDTRLVSQYNFRGVDVGDIAMVLRSNEATLGIQIEYKNYRASDFKELKGLLMMYMGALEAEDAETLVAISQLADQYMRAVKSLTGAH